MNQWKFVVCHSLKFQQDRDLGRNRDQEVEEEDVAIPYPVNQYHHIVGGGGGG